MAKAWLGALVLAVACRGTPNEPLHSTPPTQPPSTTPKSVKVAMFGDVSIDDGDVHLTDGGIHGIQGHTLIIRAAGQTTWQRRLDGMQPSGTPGTGEITLTDRRERRGIRSQRTDCE